MSLVATLSVEDFEARSHLALALDFDDLVAALRVAKPLLPYFEVAKVGSELFSAAGPDAVAALMSEGFKVFVDLKLHDIPNTVGRAAKVLGGLGASYLTVHTSGGRAMVEAATSAMAQGAGDAGIASPCVLGVTVLTSDTEAPRSELERRARIAVEGRCGGVVCAASDLEVVAALVPDLVKVVPGIRPARSGRDDQARVATPGAAIAAGADLLVVGRAVTASADPADAARSVRDEVGAALAARG